jgi:8-oxo-dGTP pyrophosphatase MutT (NUDIX family)
MKVPTADAYGGVLIDDSGCVLLREPTGHFGGYVWTFAKGRPDPGETPEETALREVLEETGQSAIIVSLISQVFPGTTSTTVFFLMAPVGAPIKFTDETKRTRWVSEPVARRLIATTIPDIGRERDLAVLAAAFDAWRVRHIDDQ